MKPRSKRTMQGHREKIAFRNRGNTSDKTRRAHEESAKKNDLKGQDIKKAAKRKETNVQKKIKTEWI